MIRIPCPQCEVVLKVPDAGAGRTVNCPKCTQPVPVPVALSLDDEPRTVELDEKPKWRVPRWVWVASATTILALVALTYIVSTVRWGPKDGLTRAERAELEAKMRTAIPGGWEAVSVDGYSVYEGFYSFSDDGQFKVHKDVGGAKGVKFVGNWSVNGSTLSIRITESADDYVTVRQISPQTLLDVKSENGKVFRFGTAWADLGPTSKHLIFTRQKEQPKVAPAPNPPTPPPAKKEESLTPDQRTAKWILGKWTSQAPDGTWEWDFFLPLETSGHYSVKIFNGGRELGSFHGQWFIVAGQLTLTVQLSFYEPMRANTSQTFEIYASTTDFFSLRILGGDLVNTLRRKK